jgi:hypothetical protein
MNTTNILELGRAGELVVIDMLKSLGLDLQIRDMYLENKYDSEKDILVDGKYRVEVKTQAPFVKMNAFTFLPNQIKKCTLADVLYFVSVPHPTWSHYSDGWIYRAVPSEMNYHPWKDRWSKERIIIPIKQDALKPVHKMPDKKSKELQQLLSTMY